MRTLASERNVEPAVAIKMVGPIPDARHFSGGQHSSIHIATGRFLRGRLSGEVHARDILFKLINYAIDCAFALGNLLGAVGFGKFYSKCR